MTKNQKAILNLLNGLRINESGVYRNDIATLKKIGALYRITLHKRKRVSGYEAIERENKDRGHNRGEAEKLATNISRARGKIFELAMSNSWTWFTTFTLSPEKYDRTELTSYKKLATWIRNHNRIHEVQIRYLIIPELHADGKSWHFHGLLEGVPREELEEFREEKGKKLPIQILIEIKKGNQIYNWPAYQKAFGYITLSEIRNGIAVSKYICKYLTKGLNETGVGLQKHLYYCSQGLKRAELIYEGHLTKELDEDYSNEYVKIKTVQSFDEAIAYFVDG
ncbi:MAG: hypothetical protein HFF45_08095 [Lawsonibacter sp.]|nr:hypothetical protein [Lawsonibacter sp.]